MLSQGGVRVPGVGFEPKAVTIRRGTPVAQLCLRTWCHVGGTKPSQVLGQPPGLQRASGAKQESQVQVSTVEAGTTTATSAFSKALFPKALGHLPSLGSAGLSGLSWSIPGIWLRMRRDPLCSSCPSWEHLVACADQNTPFSKGNWAWSSGRRSERDDL